MVRTNCSMLFHICLTALLLLGACTQTTAETRKVIVDQDAFGGPGFQPILMLMNAPGVELLGITTVSGDGWQPEETSRTLRMLELVERTDIPVAAGATFPLINSKRLTEARERLHGSAGYKGAWTETWPENDHMQRADYHAADIVPSFPRANRRLRRCRRPRPGSLFNRPVAIRARSPLSPWVL